MPTLEIELLAVAGDVSGLTILVAFLTAAGDLPSRLDWWGLVDWRHLVGRRRVIYKWITKLSRPTVPQGVKRMKRRGQRVNMQKHPVRCQYVSQRQSM